MDEIDLEELLNQAVKEIETNISLDENTMNKVLSTVSDEELDLTTLDNSKNEEVVASEPAQEPVSEQEPVSAPEPAPEPVAQEPVAQEPVAQEPVAQEPVASEPAQEPVQEPAQKSVVVNEDASSTDSKGSPDIQSILNMLNTKNSNSETMQNLIKSLSNSNTQNPLPPEVNSKLKELATLLKVYKPVVVEKVKGKNEAPKDLVDVARHTFGFFLDKMVDMLDEQEN